MKDHIVIKLALIGFIALVCYVASTLVFGLVREREQRYEEVRTEVGTTWGEAQTLVGPMLTLTRTVPVANLEPRTETRYLLPRTLTVNTVLVPEVRSRGMFDVVVYTERLRVEGTFVTDDVDPSFLDDVTLAVGISDTRSIPGQVMLSWNDTSVAFEPGAGAQLLERAGIHAPVSLTPGTHTYQYAFELAVRGSDTVQVVPLGDETSVTITSTWPQPQFLGAFLPTEPTIDPQGFAASWQVSSFGRGYPSTWSSDEPVDHDLLLSSAFGVRLYEGVDQYTQVERAAKYAILFIVVTFALFFLFEILSMVQIHPIQYVLVGAALALFYLLTLSLTEHIGFLAAYVFATVLTALLITTYSISVLKQRARALVVLSVLLGLYGYLYVVLKLEDYALLFGTVLVFVLLATMMYVTRNIDWFALATRGDGK